MSRTNVKRACFTEKGRVRPRNEDACATPKPGADEDRYGTLLAVADGVGGLVGGKTASQGAVAYLQALYYAETGTTDQDERLRGCFEAVNSLVRQTRDRMGEKKGYLTTLVATVVLDEQIWVANVGDSRAYLIDSTGYRRQLTEDQSDDVKQAKLTELNEDQGATDRFGVITQAIGLSPNCQFDSYQYTWKPGDYLVLCTDGLTSLEDREMVQIVKSNPPETAAKNLVEKAVQKDGSDNCTAVVALYEERAETSEREEPTKSRLQAKPNRAKRRLTYKEDPRSKSPGSSIGSLLLGLLLGWLSAAIVLTLLLERAGIWDVF